jgi:3-isopropylmalate dehydrogenase
MTVHKLLLLPGDGIGPEIAAEISKIIDFFNHAGLGSFEVEHDLVGGASIDERGDPLTSTTVERARASDAVLFGCVGGPKWDGMGPYHLRPEIGILGLRKQLGLFANLRPAVCHSELATSSTLKAEVVNGLDIMIVRELTGGVYFGTPKEIVTLEDGRRRAVDTQLYTSDEISRIAVVAFEIARGRRNLVHSADKNNVMRTGTLWRETVSAVHEERFSDVRLLHILADNCGMQLLRNPKQFDVIVMDNLFGDLLSDVAAMLTGSLGMLPSASLGEVLDDKGRRHALYEPIHGSAPDIAGRGIANPLAMLGSFAMCLRYSLGEPALARLVEKAIDATLATGLRTADIFTLGKTEVGTMAMGAAIRKQLVRLAETVA